MTMKPMPLLATMVFMFAIAASAIAEVGDAYLQVPGVAGGWRGKGHRNWVRIEGRYWDRNSFAISKGTAAAGARAFFPGPSGPRHGAGDLVVAVDKRSPALPALMALCARRAILPELSFAESADAYRNAALQVGERPARIPAYFEYQLRDVQFVDCPLATGAPEQALVLKFRDIGIRNYQSQGESQEQFLDGSAVSHSAAGMRLDLPPARLAPAQSSGETRSFVVRWLGFAHDIRDDQCPRMNKKPLPEDFRITPEQVAAAQADNGAHNPLELRGPGHLNVCQLPGITADPGNAAPNTRVARGLDLDGDDGSGAPPRGICRHRNFVSDDGRTGIDNQFYTVASCIAGLQGKKGLWQQVLNEEWRSGAVTLLIQISGIDNMRNDDSVDVTLLYSTDPAAKDVSGTEILPDYTFRVTDKPELTHYFSRLHARIVDGVIVTDTARELDFNLIKGPALRLADARMRLEFTPDGNLQGVLGGYQDWRFLVNYYNYSGFEVTFGFQCPAFYNALRRAADGGKDPVTGECNDISVAYDLEAIPAFIPPSRHRSFSRPRTAALQGNVK